MTEFNETVLQKYIKFVNEMFNKFERLGNLINDEKLVTPEKVNYALAMYYNLSISLNAEYQRQKLNYEILNQEFERWCDEKFEEAKKEILNEYKETKIKPSLKEFETRMRIKNREEYNIKEMEVKEAEAKVKFLSRMQEILKSYDSILVTLSSNMRQEMRTLSLDSRSMNTYKIRERINFPEKK